MKTEKPKELVPKYKKIVTVDGKKYELTYPGMRFINKWRHECTEIIGGKVKFDNERYLDFAFENCVTPVDHNFYPDQDNIQDPKLGEEWTAVILRFLRGDSLEDFQGKKEKKEPTKIS